MPDTKRLASFDEVARRADWRIQVVEIVPVRWLAKSMRQSGVKRLADVRAVVMETAGDFSVLSGEGPIDDVLLDRVRGVPRDGR